MIISGEDVARFISDKLGMAFCPPYVAIGTQVDGEVINGLLLNHYEGADIHVTAAGRGLNRALFTAVGSYIFDQLGCERATIVTASEKSASYGVRLGGKIEGRMRNHFGNGRDGIIVGILREEYIFR